MGLSFSLDGGKTYTTVEEIRLLYDFPDTSEEVVVMATEEGLITDVLHDGEIVGSESETVGDIADRLWDSP